MVRASEKTENCNLTIVGCYNTQKKWGSGGGSVGRAVTSNTRDLQFKSHHRQNFIYQLYNKPTEKTKIKTKMLGKAHLEKNIFGEISNTLHKPEEPWFSG